jgi:hypothetical protein
MYRALPQSGISDADIVYEVLAEGEITRLVAVFQNYSAEKIGPVRSARDYFVQIALEYDAIFIHHGGSDSGYAMLNTTRINRLDGMNLEGLYYWRDRSYPDWYAEYRGQTRPFEHSSYISGERILKAIEAFKFRDTLPADTDIGFKFYPVPPDNLPAGKTAVFVKVPFSRDYTRIFTYDTETRVYSLGNRDGIHYDEITAEPVTVTNILIQRVPIRLIPGDEWGRREVRLNGSGEGFYVTAGECRPVTWKKSGQGIPTRWYGENGTELTLNPGKTWICLLQDNASPVFE